MILMSLNGIKLVVTSLASPARIGLLRLFLAGICEELEYRSPVILSRGFCTFRVQKSKRSSQKARNARRRSKLVCAEEAEFHHFLTYSACALWLRDSLVFFCHFKNSRHEHGRFMMRCRIGNLAKMWYHISIKLPLTLKVNPAPTAGSFF